jgi:uncharacterized membrane protein
MTNSEIKQWAKEKLKGNLWPVFITIVVAGILTNLSFSTSSTSSDGTTISTTYNLGWLFYFVEVGLAYYLVKFIKDQKPEFNDIFHFAKDFGKCLGARLLQMLWIFLYCLLLIIPGIIKGFGYVLVPYIMADEKYRSLSIPDLLKKSEEMMKGHKWDYFCFMLSFIGWYLLIIPTLGFIMIYAGPYISVAQAKWLTTIKENAEGNAPVEEAKVEEVKEEKTEE